jgi:hypothetical protein
MDRNDRRALGAKFNRTLFNILGQPRAPKNAQKRPTKLTPLAFPKHPRLVILSLAHALARNRDGVTMTDILAADANRRRPPIPYEDREAFRPETVAEIADVPLRRVFYAIADGSLRARKAGRATLILRDDLRAWLRGLPERSHA